MYNLTNLEENILFGIKIYVISTRIFLTIRDYKTYNIYTINIISIHTKHKTLKLYESLFNKINYFKVEIHFP